jgi:tetratricopeptide (TPR) repeat protein
MKKKQARPPKPADPPFAAAAEAAEAAEALRQAIALHQQGLLGEAEALYRTILAAQPGHFDALHLLGVLAIQQGQVASGLDLIGKAIGINPHDAAAHSNFGLALHELKRPEEALDSYGQALRLRPDYVEALFNRGNALLELKRPEDAVASYDQALRLRPGCIEALFNRGNALLELKRPEDAAASYDGALQAKPDYVEALFNRGLALRDLGRLDEALDSYEQAARLRPGYAEALFNCGNALLDLKRPEEAAASYGRALELDPGNADTLNNLGNALRDLKRPAEALARYEQALQLRPGLAAALNNRGNALQDLGRQEEALASYEQALQVNPDYVDALYNGGNALLALGRLEEALACYDRGLRFQPAHANALCNRGNALQGLRCREEALASYAQALQINPGLVEAHCNESLCRLTLGDWRGGFAKYEWRWESEACATAKRNFPQPLWLGQESLQGKTILLHPEQGFGDTIQLCRYAKRVAALGATVLLEVQPALKTLLAGVAGASQTFASGEPLPAFDCHCPLMSLPLAFGTRLDTIPAESFYLRADPLRAARWQARLGEKALPRVGLAWSGSALHANDRNRSMPLVQFGKLAAGPAQFIGLQKELRAIDRLILERRPGIAYHGDGLADFAETAALIANLDLVIAVDTAVAHLAGALGKPVWLLLPFSPDWRWLLGRGDSPWYPSARLFRQAKPGDWDGVIAEVAGALALFCQAAA